MEKLNLKREMYFSILMDRVTQGPVMVGSSHGGTSIEDVAEETPEKIFTESINIMTGPKPEQLARLARNMGVDKEYVDQAVEVLQNLYNMFIGADATLVEINPLGETTDGKSMCWLVF